MPPFPQHLLLISQLYVTPQRPEVLRRLTPWPPPCPTRDFPRGGRSGAEVASLGADWAPPAMEREFSGRWETEILDYLKAEGLESRSMDQASPFSVKRPVRARMQGVMGAGGEKPPANRLYELLLEVI